MSHKPKMHSLDSLHEGLVERFVFEPTEKMMQSFMEISGDMSPVHTDVNFATSRGNELELDDFKRQLAYLAENLITMGTCLRL